jgi:3-hydroxyacyl-CoA dehydrogenase/enoyl-CoA hydratase/3-hydroxybutyryl-CoA epimerase/enoyl-CoA isomerase
MIYEGKAIQVNAIDNGFVQLNFDLQGESVNKFNKLTLDELRSAVAELQKQKDIKGMVVTSSKDSFIVGADITEFLDYFKLPEADLAKWCMDANKIFSAIEDLPFPTVTAVNGVALGGGFEMCLSTDYRVMSTKASVGLPEVKLGIFPGFGGTVRLPRLIGVDNALEWIATGKDQKPDNAFKVGAVDAVVEPDQLFNASLKLLQQCTEGKIDYKKRRAQKINPLQLNNVENMMAFETAKAVVAGEAGPNYPAPITAVKTIQKHSMLTRDEAIPIESAGFAKMAKTEVAANLVGLFLNDQYLKKIAKGQQKAARSVTQAAVLGAGIMGGGIAYQSASKGTPIVMKDINEKAIEHGFDEASKLLLKEVERGRLTNEKMTAILSDIRGTLSYGDFANVNVVVEAVVEKEAVKKSVLAEVEKNVTVGTILTSNTSTISITELATALQRPEDFCGMHFFNPVNRMPLVEVIRGKKSSEAAIATVVAYARAMGKTPIVINDCAGFLVNRVLFPYFGGFAHLVHQGVDFLRIDKVMEKFGWPMGPAYLLDVVGMDTAYHAAQVLAQAYPDRMKYGFVTADECMFKAGRLGQKNNIGFYKYEAGKGGRPNKVVDQTTFDLLKQNKVATVEVTDEDIIARMMIPLCIETVRCVEENIVASAVEADMGLIMGIGFPPFRGGALRYIDSIGMKTFCELADQYKDLGALYVPTPKMREMATSGEKFFN